MKVDGKTVQNLIAILHGEMAENMKKNKKFEAIYPAVERDSKKAREMRKEKLWLVWMPSSALRIQKYISMKSKPCLPTGRLKDKVSCDKIPLSVLTIFPACRQAGVACLPTGR